MTLSPWEISQLPREEAEGLFLSIRFAENGGEPFCPHCKCTAIYELKRRSERHCQVYECQACRKQFSATSNTIFAGRKMAIHKLLYAIMTFVDGVSGVAALRLRREVNCSYKTSFVLEHKLREAIGNGLVHSGEPLSGKVEVDGLFFNRHTRKENKGRKSRDTRKLGRIGQQCIVFAKEREGRARAYLVPNEGSSVPSIQRHVKEGSIIYADDSDGWNALEATFEVRRVNHSKEFANKDKHVNGAESTNSRFRKAASVYHRVRGVYLGDYANEIAWRAGFNRQSNGQQFMALAGAATHHAKSTRWAGYWQRWKKTDVKRRVRAAS